MASDSASSKAALDKVGQAVGTAKMNKAALMKDKARADFLEVTAPMRSKVMSSMKASIKSGVLADPDMWPCVKNAASAVMDQLLSDVEREIERNLHTALLQQKEDADQPGPSGGIFCWWYRLRAFVLYHYLPHDKLLFGKLKDPVYLVIYLATLVPIHGVRICVFALLLLMLVVPGKPDEFQLINFILLCKGMQFLTSGLIQLAAGATKYFACYSLAKDDILECINNHGPGANDGFGLALDYLGSIALVWVAFGLLTRSEKHGQDRHQKVTVEDEQKAEKAGGRLRSLLHWDRKCFFGSLILLAFLTVCTCWQHFEEGFSGLSSLAADPQFQANIFWCCVGYSILSLPFAPFMISGLQEVMTHCYATGYNKNGACVSFDMPSVDTEVATATKADAGYNLSFTTMASHATNLLNTINRGRAMRGAEDLDAMEYKFGDFSRGVWANLTGAKPRASRASSASDASASSSSSSSAQRPTSSSGEWWHAEEIARHFKKLGGGEDSRRSTGDATDELGVTAPIAEEAAPEDSILFAVSTVEIPAEFIEERDGTAHFCLRVVPEGSLDAESALEVWEVIRRYSEFEKLASKLGKQCHNFPDAPFPKKTWGACTGEKLEDRRVKLQAWLSCALRSPLAEAEWSRPLNEFLTVQKYGDEAEGKNVFEDIVKVGKSSSSQSQGKNVFEDIVKAGSAVRAGSEAHDAKYQFGDFTRGLWSRMKQKSPAESSDKPAEGFTQTTTEEAFANIPNVRLTDVETFISSAGEAEDQGGAVASSSAAASAAAADAAAASRPSSSGAADVGGAPGAALPL